MRFLIALFLLFSCAEKASEEIYQGRLEELIAGDFVLEKDFETKFLHNIQVLRDSERDVLYYNSTLPNLGETALKFHGAESGKRIFQINFFNEGPEALKGVVGARMAIGENRVISISSLGYLGIYDSLGKKVEEIEIDLQFPASLVNSVRMEGRRGLMYFDQEWVSIGQDPSTISGRYELKSRLAEFEFPLDFTSWISFINVETGEVRHSDFKAPMGYEVFKNDLTATQLLGAFDSKRKSFYLGFPYSDALYRMEGADLKERISLPSTISYNYLPSEVIAWGEIYTAWVLPKEASKHLFLVYDPYRDLLIRASKINESGAGETQFSRTKHYILGVFSGELEPLGEYFFDYKGEIEVENWFLTRRGLFINKPEQESEDEYEFYHVDLSSFERN